ncbi:MAG: HD domain-containing protein, partial [Cloacibacillus sp.]
VDAPITSGIFDIVENLNGKLVLLADTGVHIADKKALFAGDDVKWESYMHRDGLHSTVTANSWNQYDGSGKLYLCGTNGLYSINLDNVQKNKHRPKLAVNRVTADGKVFENTTKIEIPSTTKRLTVDLAVLSYMNPDYNRGQYRLKGFDKEENYGGPKELSNISYTNLKGGTYTLEFTAENSDGVTSTAPLEIIIVKERAFHERPAVVVMALLLLAALIFLLTRWYYQRRAKELERRQEELRAIVAQAFSAIADTIDAKDTYTRGHSTRVAEYSVAVAKEMGFSQQQLDNLYYTALLHDIGKIGIPDNILNKPAKLTDEEYEIMKQHPAKGGHILRNITIIDEIKDGAAYHHEKYDGTGYNEGLKREAIPLIARIICVADALDAMASTRPYRT